MISNSITPNKEKTILSAVCEVITLKAQRACSLCALYPVDQKSMRCLECGSDDLMLYMSGVGQEWHAESLIVGYFIDYLGFKPFKQKDLEKLAEESLCEMLDEEPPVKIGWGEYFRSEILKNCCPRDYEIALNETMNDESFLIDGECKIDDLEDTLFVELGGSYWRSSDVQNFLAPQE